jgi:hypothetical protein
MREAGPKKIKGSIHVARVYHDATADPVLAKRGKICAQRQFVCSSCRNVVVCGQGKLRPGHGLELVKIHRSHNIVGVLRQRHRLPFFFLFLTAGTFRHTR